MGPVQEMSKPSMPPGEVAELVTHNGARFFLAEDCQQRDPNRHQAAIAEETKQSAYLARARVHVVVKLDLQLTADLDVILQPVERSVEIGQLFARNGPSGVAVVRTYEPHQEQHRGSSHPVEKFIVVQQRT